MAGEEGPTALWFARVLELVDATEKNAAWITSGASSFRDWLKVAWRERRAQLRGVVSNRIMDAQQVLREKANSQAKKLGLATPADIQELNHSIDQLRCTLELWLDCVNDNDSDLDEDEKVSTRHAERLPEVHRQDSVTLES